MPTLVLKVSGLPKTGKTAVLANIATFLKGSGVNVVWSNPDLPLKPNAQVDYPGDKIEPNTSIILEEIYEDGIAPVSPTSDISIVDPYQ